jgi:hypothetical protein
LLSAAEVQALEDLFDRREDGFDYLEVLLPPVDQFFS